ncbi:MAG TPA: MATE family efflux transporter, partial [Herpetosiphonaceae bacterium]|nr:MATE family efflux transporter [Herpetosiphonaceae bacterium]
MSARVERLGTEKIGTLLWTMSAQTTFALLLAAVCGVAETAILSRGINALAAAGAAIVGPVLIALSGVTTTLGAGGASVVSRALGARQGEKAGQTVANTFVIFWAAALLIAGLGTAFIEPLVYLLGATESIAPYAIAYGRIIFLGAVTSTGFSAIIRADGSAGYAMAIWVIPLTVNLLLCWLCVMVWRLGAAGAALATVAGQVV